MINIKKGNIVVRKSYGKDILFEVIGILKTNFGYIALLRGIFERVIADSSFDDLEIVNKKVFKNEIKSFNKKINDKIKNYLNFINYSFDDFKKNRYFDKNFITGKILHLDGDKKYALKSYYYYKKLGLNAIVKNIPEFKQPKLVYSLLKLYNPDILVITRS